MITKTDSRILVFKTETRPNLKIKENTKPSLLNHLKKTKASALRIAKLEMLIRQKELDKFEFESAQLKAVLFLFPKLDRFTAFKRLVNQVDINLSALSEPEIKALTACLSQDPLFNKLLPFDKKNFGGVFPAKQAAKKATLRSVSSVTENLINHRGQPTMSAARQGSKPLLPSNAANNKRLSLSQLRLSLIKEPPESRLNFFKRLEIKNAYQAKLAVIDLETFKTFIEIFPSNDAIKFLNFPLIRDQVEGLKRQHGQLSKESYIDLVNYFKPYQQDAIKKLLRPISPIINTKYASLGIFKEKIDLKAAWAHQLPDIVASHHRCRIR